MISEIKNNTSSRSADDQQPSAYEGVLTSIAQVKKLAGNSQEKKAQWSQLIRQVLYSEGSHASVELGREFPPTTTATSSGSVGRLISLLDSAIESTDGDDDDPHMHWAASPEVVPTEWLRELSTYTVKESPVDYRPSWLED